MENFVDLRVKANKEGGHTSARLQRASPRAGGSPTLLAAQPHPQQGMSRIFEGMSRDLKVCPAPLRVCPVDALIVHDKEGRQVVPDHPTG